MRELLKQSVSHLGAIIIFLLISFAYFTPMLEGRVLQQTDVIQYEGASEEVNAYYEKHGKPALWTNSMFGGMPAYLINMPQPNNLLTPVNKWLNLNFARPASFVFLYLLGFYIVLLCFRIRPWLAVIGAIAYAFSSYFFVIIDAGHVTKAVALGYMPIVIGGFHLAFHGRRLLGFSLFALSLGLLILTAHYQITYYSFLILLVYGIFLLVDALRNKWIPGFLKTTALLIIAVLLALSANAARLWSNYEYSKYSIRGPSELTSEQEDRTSGLDKSYATAWSYGITETLSLYIPNIKGGASIGSLSENSEIYDLFRRAQGPAYARDVIKQLPLYWGKQPHTSGPVYLGAAVCFIFLFSLFVTGGHRKWWLVTIIIVSMVLSWGANFMFLTDLFLEYFPAYTKFRTVSMILVIAEFGVPLLAIMGVQKLMNEDIRKPEFLRAMKYALGILAAVSLLFILFPGLFFDFTGPADARYQGQEYKEFLSALKADRKTMLRLDALRSLFFVVAAAALLWAHFYKRLTRQAFLIALALIILIDMWAVNKRYLNNDDFTTERNFAEQIQPTAADRQIMQDTARHFRVFDLSSSPFQSARASKFHSSLGGYHGAKIRRYQEIIEQHISQNNMGVLNMLNTKYFIVPDRSQGRLVAQHNPGALGNAWFVDQFEVIPDADAEIERLGQINPGETALVDKRFEEQLEGVHPDRDTTAQIRLSYYSPDTLKYRYSSKTEQLALFSELYYPAGWQAYIDGEEQPHFRANYILRAMVVPPGEHSIGFVFRPKAYYAGRNISLAGSLLIILLFIGAAVFETRNFFTREKEE